MQLTFNQTTHSSVSAGSDWVPMGLSRVRWWFFMAMNPLFKYQIRTNKHRRTHLFLATSSVSIISAVLFAFVLCFLWKRPWTTRILPSCFLFQVFLLLPFHSHWDTGPQLRLSWDYTILFSLSFCLHFSLLREFLRLSFSPLRDRFFSLPISVALCVTVKALSSYLCSCQVVSTIFIINIKCLAN